MKELCSYQWCALNANCTSFTVFTRLAYNRWHTAHTLTLSRRFSTVFSQTWANFVRLSTNSHNRSAYILRLQKCTKKYSKDSRIEFSGRSSARGRQTRVGWGKQAIFELNTSIFSKMTKWQEIQKLMLMTSGKLTAVLCAFDWYQDRWRWMALNCWYKFEFSENFAGFRRLGRHQLLNEWT